MASLADSQAERSVISFFTLKGTGYVEEFQEEIQYLRPALDRKRGKHVAASVLLCVRYLSETIGRHDSSSRQTNRSQSRRNSSNERLGRRRTLTSYQRPY